jgi:hypothetical protein
MAIYQNATAVLLSLADFRSSLSMQQNRSFKASGMISKASLSVFESQISSEKAKIFLGLRQGRLTHHVLRLSRHVIRNS